MRIRIAEQFRSYFDVDWKEIRACGARISHAMHPVVTRMLRRYTRDRTAVFPTFHEHHLVRRAAMPTESSD